MLFSLFLVCHLGSVQLAVLTIDLTGHVGAAVIVSKLLFAVYGVIGAVMTVVAHYEVLSPAERSQLLRYWTPRISRELREPATMLLS